MRIRTFFQSEKGSAIILFALLLPVLTGAIGLSIDFGQSVSLKFKLQACLDAAVIAAGKAARSHVDKNGSSKTSVAAATAQGTATGLAVFASNAKTLNVELAAAPSASISINVTKDQVSASGQAAADYKTLFSKVLNIQTINIGVESEAVSIAPKYTNVSIAMDISQSMGIGATQSDMDKLYYSTLSTFGAGCVFACHNPWGPYTESLEAFAARKQITLRIDSLRQAILNLLNSAESSGGRNYYSFTFYTIAKKLSRVAGPSNNYGQLRSYASTISLNAGDSKADTYLNESLNTLSSSVPTAGDGASASTARQLVVLVTDGVFDADYGPHCVWGHCTGPISTGACDTLKANGATVAVIYTTYLPVYNIGTSPASGLHTNYRMFVDPFSADIDKTLKRCASSDYFFEAKDGSAIDEAFTKIFSAQKSLTLNK